MAERKDRKNRNLWKGEYQKADGRYMYKYKDASGADRFVYSWCLTQTDRPPKGKKSDKCLREMEQEIAEDVHDGVSSFRIKDLTLNEAFDDYINNRANLKLLTVTHYTKSYDRHFRNGLGLMKIVDIQYSDIIKVSVRKLKTKEIKPVTVIGLNNIISPVFESAVRENYIRTNPVKYANQEIRKRWDASATKKHALTVDEQERLLEFMKNNKSYKKRLPEIVFLLGTGCRIGEMIGLTWKDCDFKNNIISINHTLIYEKPFGETKYRRWIDTPKTARGNRKIPMLSDVREVLLQEKERQRTEGTPNVEIDGYKGFVFLSQNKTPYNKDSFNSLLDNVVNSYNKLEKKNAERDNREPVYLPKISPHTLRHTFCTRLCENETNIKVIQELMGHSNISITMDIYNEATIEKKQEVIENFDGKMKLL